MGYLRTTTQGSVLYCEDRRQRRSVRRPDGSVYREVTGGELTEEYVGKLDGTFNEKDFDVWFVTWTDRTGKLRTHCEPNRDVAVNQAGYIRRQGYSDVRVACTH